MNKKALIVLLSLSIGLSLPTPSAHAGIGKGILAVLTTAGGAAIGYQWGKTAEQEISLIQIMSQASTEPNFFKKLDQVGTESQGRWAVGSMMVISAIMVYFLGTPAGLGLGGGLIGGYIEGRVLEESRPLADKFEKKANTWAAKIEKGLENLEKEFTKK